MDEQNKGLEAEETESGEATEQQEEKQFRENRNQSPPISYRHRAVADGRLSANAFSGHKPQKRDPSRPVLLYDTRQDGNDERRR